MGRHPAVYLMGRGAIPSRRGFSRGAMRHPGVSGITRPFGRLSRGRGQVLHVLLSRSPLASLRRGVPFDLHVLGAPPAFILSQDQTLMFKFVRSKSVWLILPFYCCFRFLFSEISLRTFCSVWNFQGCITVYLSRCRSSQEAFLFKEHLFCFPESLFSLS